MVSLLAIGALYTLKLHTAKISWSGGGVIEETEWINAQNHIYRSYDQCVALATIRPNKALCYCAKMIAKDDDALFHAKLTHMIQCTRDAQEEYYDMDFYDDCTRDATTRSAHDECTKQDNAKKGRCTTLVS